MICTACVYLETFGQKDQDKFFNKCGLLDIWNLEEGEECEYFKDAHLTHNNWEIINAVAATYPRSKEEGKVEKRETSAEK